MLAVALALGSTQMVSAQTESTGDLYDMSLEELLDYAVVSATKSEVNVRKAPSVVRVYTQKDFAEYGFTSLNQVLETIPGIQVQNYRAGHQLVWVRGVQARYNNKILFLIDGVPMRDGFYGNATFDDLVPIETVDRVEVLNGPGSVLYGANSFAAVINVTTKKQGTSAGARYGTFSTAKAYAEAGAKNFYGNATYTRSNGFQPQFMTDGLRRDVDQSIRGVSGMLKYQKEGLMVTGGFSDYHHPYTYRSTDKQYAFDRTPLYGTVAYNFDVGEKAKVNTSAFINRYNFAIDKIKYTDEQSYEVKELVVENLNTVMEGAEANYFNTFGKFQVTAGLSYFRDRSSGMTENVSYHIKGEDKTGVSPLLVVEQISRSNVGAYLQNVIAISENIDFTSGVRYENLSDFDDQFNYRMALTGQFDNIYSKLLFGTAYRVPSYREYLTVDAPNLDLQPEHLATLEAQVGYKLAQGDINLTFYRNNYTDFIGEVDVAELNRGGTVTEIGDEMAFNFDRRTITGTELSSLFYLNNKLLLNIGAGYIISATEEMGELPSYVVPENPVVSGEKPLYFLSRFTSNVAASYQFSKKFKLGTGLLFNSKRKVPAIYQADVPAEVQNPDNANAFVRVNMHATYNPTERISIIGRTTNLLNADIYSPPFGGADNFDAEWPGRILSLEARYRIRK